MSEYDAVFKEIFDQLGRLNRRLKNFETWEPSTPPVTTLPDDPTPGTIVFLTVTNTLYYYDGTTWIEIGSGGFTEGACVTNTISQTVNDVTPKVLDFDTELWDTDDIHDTVTNNSRLTCQTDGKYLVIGSFRWASLFNANLVYNQIYLDGSSVIAQNATHGLNTSLVERQTSIILDLVGGQYVELRAYQNSGGPQSVFKEFNKSPRFAMHRIG